MSFEREWVFFFGDLEFPRVEIEVSSSGMKHFATLSACFVELSPVDSSMSNPGSSSKPFETHGHKSIHHFKNTTSTVK